MSDVTAAANFLGIAIMSSFPDPDSPSTPIMQSNIFPIEIKSQNFTPQPNCYIVEKETKLRFGLDRNTIKQHSKVLDAAFTKESKDPDEYEIEVEFHPTIIIEAMRFIHHSSWCKNHDVSDTKNYQLMIPFAHQYEIQTLQEFCEMGMISHLAMNMEMLEFADKYHLSIVKKECIKELSVNWMEMYQHDRNLLNKCSKETLIELETQRRKEFWKLGELDSDFLRRLTSICKNTSAIISSVSLHMIINEYRDKRLDSVPTGARHTWKRCSEMEPDESNKRQRIV